MHIRSPLAVLATTAGLAAAPVAPPGPPTSLDQLGIASPAPEAGA
jgi:hypothetical protein